MGNYEKKNWEVTIISLYTDRSDTVFNISNSVEIIHGKIKSNNNIKPYLIDMLSLGNYNVIFTFHPWIGLEFLKIRNRFLNMCWIATEHSSPYDYSWKRRLLNLLVYARADKLIVLTEYAKKYYIKRRIYHTCVIPNALPFETDKRGDVSAKKMVAIGRIEQVKRFDLLIDAFAEIADKKPDWTLELVGDGSQKKSLQEKVINLGLENQVIFRGYQKNIEEICLGASFCVISSEREGFSLVALEALECGLPLVLFDIPSIREIVGEYNAARFIQPGNVHELSKAMIRLINNPEELKNMADEAKKCAENYCISSIGEKWEALLKEIL